MSDKVSVGQCMAEILCLDVGAEDDYVYDKNDMLMYKKWGNVWNSLSDELSHDILKYFKEYLVEQLGEDKVED